MGGLSCSSQNTGGQEHDKKTYCWELIETSNVSSIERYCHNCGRKVVFTDSMKRRQNANGKNIYEYAIYKCEKGHTWNMLLNKCKSLDYVEDSEGMEDILRASRYDILNLIDLKNEGVDQIEIILDEVLGRWRIDTLLRDKLENLSRSKICELIKNKKILVDGEAVKQGYILKRQQKITIFLEDFNTSNTPTQS